MSSVGFNDWARGLVVRAEIEDAFGGWLVDDFGGGGFGVVRICRRDFW